MSMMPLIKRYIRVLTAISVPDHPPAKLLGLSMVYWRGLGSFGLTTTVPNKELQVDITLPGQYIFLPDIRTTFSVLMKFWRTTSSSHSSFVRVGEQPYQPRQTQPFSCVFRSSLIPSFLVIPIVPSPGLEGTSYSKWEPIFPLISPSA